MDRAKVMVGLTGLRLWLTGQLILIPGHEDLQNALTVCTDALALLKEQETKWIHRADMDYKDKNGVVHFHGMCESCGFIHDFIDGHTGQYKFCPECGRSVKWE